MAMRVTAIAAMALDRTIGTGTGIPWQLPEDQRHFRGYTAGKALLLGRTTFEEMLGWFTDHRPITLSSNPSYKHPVATASVSSVADAIAAAEERSEHELVVCGGAKTYASALPFTTDVILTEIDATFEGTAKFPPLPESKWRVVERTDYPKSSSNPLNFSIVHYQQR